MKKRGFTLIELLAVIIILAILIIIAVPNVLNILKEAKENTFKTEIQSVMKAAEQQFMVDTMINNGGKACYDRTSLDVSLSSNDLSYRILMSDEGKIVSIEAVKLSEQFIGSAVNQNEINISSVENAEEIACYVGDIKYPKDITQLETMIKNQSSETQLNLILPTKMEYELTSGIANNKTINFIGNGTQKIDIKSKAGSGGVNYQTGAKISFENLTIKAGTGTYDGIQSDELSLRKCTVTGKITLYNKATFILTTFENDMADQYSIWTWGGKEVAFNSCTFNTNGKAILLYASSNHHTKINVYNTTFNDRNDGSAGKAAIEVGNDYGSSYTIAASKNKVNGFAINSKGINTNSKLWANKNSMDQEHLSVTVDGIKVY